jgi:hypothetical protein
MSLEDSAPITSPDVERPERPASAIAASLLGSSITSSTNSPAISNGRTSEGYIVIKQEDMYTHVFSPIEEEVKYPLMISVFINPSCLGLGLQVYGGCDNTVYTKSKL